MNNDQQRDMNNTNNVDVNKPNTERTPRKNAGQFQKGSERAREAGRKGGRASH